MKKFCKYLQSLIGVWHWSPPPWCHYLNQHKKQTFIALGGLILLGLISWRGYLWWEARPKPQYATYQISTLYPTSLKFKDARPNDLYIDFSESVAEIKSVNNKALDKDLIKIDPEIKGSFSWSGERSLKFTPDEDWPVGVKEHVTFSKKLFRPEVVLKDYFLDFTTPQFNLEITKKELYQNPLDHKDKRIVFHLRATHSIDTLNIKKFFSLEVQNPKKSLSFDIKFGEKNSEIYLVSEAITIPARETSAVLEIEKGIRSIRGGNEIEKGLSAEVTIPSVFTYFKVDEAQIRLVDNEKNQTEQILALQFTDSVLEKELLKNIKFEVLPEKDSKELAKEIPLQLIPNAKDESNLYNFKFQAPVGRTVRLEVKSNLSSTGEYRLPVSYVQKMEVPPFPKLLKIQQTGGILAFSGEKKLGIVARQLKKYRVKISRVVSNQISHIVSQTMGKATDPMFFSRYQFSYENLSEVFHEDRIVNSEYDVLDLGKYLAGGNSVGRGLFYINLIPLDEKNKEEELLDSRLILITDLGLVVKKNRDGSRDVFVQSIQSGEAISNATVEILGKNGLSILSATTNIDGVAKFPNLKSFTHEKEPTVISVKKGDDHSFIPVEMRDRGLKLSRFDIGGNQSSENGNQLVAYLFSDRGIYRPGDTFNIGYMVKNENWSPIAEGTPLQLEIHDPQSTVIYREQIKLNSSGFSSFSFKTNPSSPTGAYQASIYLIDAQDSKKLTLLGSNYFKVEEFLPDSMKITTHFSKEEKVGWVHPVDLATIVRLNNLFGTPSIGHAIKGSFTLNPIFPRVENYPDFTFFDPLKKAKSYDEELESKVSNDLGEVKFDLDLKRFETGTYRLLFSAEGFELAGGRSVVAQNSIIVSPMDFIMGYKADTQLDYLKKSSIHKLSLIALNPKLQLMEVKDCSVELFQIQNLSVLTKANDETYHYESVKKQVLVSSKKHFAINSNAATKLAIDTKEVGNYLLVVKKDKQELLKVEYSVVGESNQLKKLERNAELEIKLSKNDFSEGEEIEMQITSPYTGHGLITIEREKVYAHKWFKTTTTNSVQTIKIPSNLMGNAYVHVAFVRGLDSEEIYTSPLSYGVVPFSISKQKRQIDIKLETTKLVKPGEWIDIEASVSQNAKIVVWGVNEGILQVAGYKTPDPLNFYFQKKMLEVETTQLMDLILPEFSVMKKLSAIGGDYVTKGARGSLNLNPFKRKSEPPVVYWSGVIDADKESATVLRYKVPDYFNGSMRFMAVAINNEAIGSTENMSTVRGDFVLTPVVPLFVTPNDEFSVTLGIANNSENTNKIEAKVKASNDFLQIVDSKPISTTIEKGHEGKVTFKFKALEKLGAASIEFLVNDSTHYKVELSVRPATQLMTMITGGTLRKEKKEVPIKRNLYNQKKEISAEISLTPTALLKGLEHYLENYPYGCTEQLLSKIFPVMILNKQPKMEETLSILRSRQNSEGAFVAWDGMSESHIFYTLYAYHFMTTAKSLGQKIPEDLLIRTQDYLKNVFLEHDPTNLSSARMQAYALYLLAKEGIVAGNALVALRSYLDKLDKKSWENDLTAILLAATYRLYKVENEAEKIVNKLKFSDVQVTDYATFIDQFFRDGLYLTILAKHFPEKLNAISGEEIEKFIRPIFQQSYNSLSSAMAIMGIDAYSKAKEAENQTATNKPTVKLLEKEKKYLFEGFDDRLSFYQLSETGFDKNNPEEELRKGMEVFRTITDASGAVIKTAKLGKEYSVHLKYRSLDKRYISNVAIIDLLPAGFEIKEIPKVDFVDYLDRREDRLVVYTGVSPDIKEIVYSIKATNVGKFRLPAAYGEGMYDRSVQARSLGGEIVVEE